LFGGVCVIKVGVYIEVELKEKKYCIEDVVFVMCVVIEEGIVSGGGLVLI